jgi:Family of unknown function (DUF5996)
VEPWPELPYEAWHETKETLRLYLQVAGKVRATLSPLEPGWGHAPFYLTARGVTTSPIPLGEKAFEIGFDFVDHFVLVRITDGRVHSIALEPRTVAAFHGELLELLASEGIEVSISSGPSDVEDGIPFADDTVHSSYDAEWANRWWHVLVAVRGVLAEHRAAFYGRVTPVQLWWGSMDLAYSRFGAAEHAAGFWPGDANHPSPAFYAYTSPRPAGLESASVEPEAAGWSEALGEFLLPYDAVRSDASPRAAFLAFLESAYAAGS